MATTFGLPESTSEGDWINLLASSVHKLQLTTGGLLMAVNNSDRGLFVNNPTVDEDGANFPTPFLGV